MVDVSDAKRRLLERLKLLEASTAPELAAAFGLTDTAVRQHLDALAEMGLVERTASAPSGRGRPPSTWRLTSSANVVFPDRHADLAVELLDATRDRFGADSLDALLASRSETQIISYRARLGDGPLAERVTKLAAQRTVEGYLADATPCADGQSFELVEHHCPIADAVRSCGTLCTQELHVIRTVLGPDVSVERTHHLLAGDRRCAYTIYQRSSGGSSLGPTLASNQSLNG